ncbi:hypothetical protein DICPUDRAFT_25157 [Dictyostelium purpureum]|uniref:Saposin B-type domain-containing protein n=1 Tax=Dictyostelium purpureum TaxID=5786 RepID=F0Z6G7_DICPU|nr:uncharacterized protein DICPUDRAFT_25157 [Dictyostelium purpureum]EGC40438.1 hypothetical protein DICPUDRAFT_25157 [Dictyostelium purpureum]|eukprot:XP_003282985.1 hypothetical protein DICPUDRAFT_25157 [Dictyostelium purpureum]
MRFLFFLIVCVLAFATNAARAFECDMCQFAYSVTEDLVNQNVSVTEIIPFVSSACNYHGEEFSGACEEIVDTFGFELMNKVVEQQTAVDACTDLGVCEFTPGLLKKHHWKKHLKPHNPFKKLKCSACKHVVKAAEKTINKGTDEGKSFAHSECKHLGKPLSHVCNKVVDKVFHKVVDELRRHEDPNKICHKVHMC